MKRKRECPRLKWVVTEVNQLAKYIFGALLDEPRWLMIQVRHARDRPRSLSAECSGYRSYNLTNGSAINF
ncbi:hypothetical protein J6590_068166 [Homalodisca vitripennis]|nr:hypothetical protein J6590_068166 [Homalodisca vitripennis]